MPPEIEQLQRIIAQGVFDDLLAEGWVQAKYSVLAITMFSEEKGYYLHEDGERTYFLIEVAASDAFRTLRIQMAALHQNKHA